MLEPARRHGLHHVQPGTGLTPSLTPTATGGLLVCVDYLALSGITFNASTRPDGFGNQISNVGVGFGRGDNTCLPSG